MAITAEDPGSLVPGKAFARTYSNRVYDDPWEAVQDYYEVMSFAHEHPEAGARPIARYFNLPRGRVSPWLRDSKPDPVRGLESARKHGWIDVDPGSDVFRGLNALLAWIFSGGSIASKTFVPYLVLRTHHDAPYLTKAAVLANTELDFTRDASATRARELRPTTDASILGRVLTVLGAPVGDKDEDVRLPDYLHAVSDRLAQEYVQVYLHNRGQEENGETVIRFGDTRDEVYPRSVARLIRRLTGERVSASGQDVELSRAAAREVAVWDPLLGVE